MKTNAFFAQKKPAQAMVEFAIALPVLLLLLYGILEAGRLLFLYSTVVTASRQAARYGTTTGDGGGSSPLYGAVRPTVPRYQDCAGIRGAANAVAYLSQGTFDDIQLAYDSGPEDTTPTTYCTAGTTTEVSPSAPTIPELQGNSTRLVVTVTENFVPLVKLVPFGPRAITATSARTILYAVPIVVEEPPQIYPQPATETLIVRDLPDPSVMNEVVPIQVRVNDLEDPSNTPSGTVIIQGADDECTINYPAQDSCDVTFANAGVYYLTAIYTPDDEHLPSVSDLEDHTVKKAETQTQFVSVFPEPSTRGEVVTVAVTVTGGPSTPTGVVEIDGGGNVTCDITLAGGAGSCQLIFNNIGDKTIVATYTGDAIHEVSSAVVGHEVLQWTPTPTNTPTITPIPSPTLIPSDTPTPTIVPTPVPSCSSISHGRITKSGNSMLMTINNPYGFPLMLSSVTVTWNDDKGHKSGSDKTLRLVDASLGGVSFWSDPVGVGNVSFKTIPTSATIPAGPTTATLVFTFHQSYDTFDGTERIIVNFATPGCQAVTIDSRIP
jgi:hypothetical protein